MSGVAERNTCSQTSDDGNTLHDIFTTSNATDHIIFHGEGRFLVSISNECFNIVHFTTLTEYHDTPHYVSIVVKCGLVHTSLGLSILTYYLDLVHCFLTGKIVL